MNDGDFYSKKLAAALQAADVYKSPLSSPLLDVLLAFLQRQSGQDIFYRGASFTALFSLLIGLITTLIRGEISFELGSIEKILSYGVVFLLCGVLAFVAWQLWHRAEDRRALVHNLYADVTHFMLRS